MLEKNKKRAERRSAKARMRHRVEQNLNNQYSNVDKWPDFEEWKKSYVSRHADNPKSCSCWMCENPRRYGELTMQEKRISQREKFCEES